MAHSTAGDAKYRTGALTRDLMVAGRRKSIDFLNLTEVADSTLAVLRLVITW